MCTFGVSLPVSKMGTGGVLGAVGGTASGGLSCVVAFGFDVDSGVCACAGLRHVGAAPAANLGDARRSASTGNDVAEDSGGAGSGVELRGSFACACGRADEKRASTSCLSALTRDATCNIPSKQEGTRVGGWEGGKGENSARKGFLVEREEEASDTGRLK